MSNKKEMPKQIFSGEMKKGEKYHQPFGHPVEGHS
jgi:hypothetical protein